MACAMSGRRTRRDVGLRGDPREEAVANRWNRREGSMEEEEEAERYSTYW